MPTPIRIDVWSDYVCPFCYLELPELMRLQQEFGPAVQIEWRAFELRPEPNPTLDPAGEYLRTTWERSVYPMAQERGMTLKLPPVQPRSRKALEAAAFSKAEGAFDPMHEAIFRAFFEAGRDIGQTDVLVDIGKEVGLPTDRLRAALHNNIYTPQVLEDQQLARQFGISGVPVMLMRPDGAPWQQAAPLQGAVPYPHIRAAVEHLARESTQG
jgi:predicted DsbA family dithiol-disulfide isomerase